MKIKCETYDYEGYSFKEGLSGTYNGTTFCTSYTDYPIFLLFAKFRIWLRFKTISYVAELERRNSITEWR